MEKKNEIKTPVYSDEEIVENINQEIDFIKKIISDRLEEEGITQDILDAVDLDIEYSPVIPFRGDKPWEVEKLRNNRYWIRDHPLITSPISEDELKVMRCRFLLARKPVTLNDLGLHF